MVYLQIESGAGSAGEQARRLELGDTPVQVGRLAGNTLVLEDNLISRKHCIFSRAGEQYTVQDLGSANGTYVNGERIAQGAILQTGDVISVGRFQIRFIDESQPIRAAAAVPQAAEVAAEPSVGL